MDDEDSQDELINRNTAHSKGKRAALWAISDDSDNAEEESEEGESDSGQEEEEDHLDGEDNEEEEDDEEEEEEEDDEEEEEDAKAEDGAFGGTSADLEGMSSDEDADKCPICLNSFNSQPVATPESCEHYFCLDCILEWAKNANSCPVDRIAFNSIYLRKCFGGKVKKMITVQKPVKEGQEERVDLDLEQTNCEVCGGSDREDRLLLCDGCDAGYHMECLTPPLDSVPVEEWFCPECVANNRHSRGSAEEISDTESLPSTARPATSRSQPHAAGPTRAIARTQQSERVRANVNRHRITQARTSQLAPTYMIQSTWLDDTINAVVAGLNTSVYIRDFTPRAPSRRRRKTGKRRKVKRKTSSAVGTKGKVGSTGVRRRRRRVRRTKAKRKLMLKKTATARGRIANNLGIVKDKKSSSLPTVYRPSEHTLSGMRADIGAASLSIYGDPFDLDPFDDREEEEQQARVTSLLEAKRRGISRSALRSHQPVARPVTASLSRRGMDVPQSGGVVEAAPVPDLLGSILSGQSMLLMDSSDVVINRDGSLKATKPIMPSASKPGCSTSSSSVDACTQVDQVMSPTQRDRSLSPHYNGDFPGSSHSSTNRPLSQSSSRPPTHMPSSASHIRPSPHSDLPPRGHPSLQPPRPVRPPHPPSHRGTNGVGVPSSSSSIELTIDSSSKSKGMSPSESKKAPLKPMWEGVSVLPRIPKIKRESSGNTNDSYSSSRGSSSNSTGSSNGYGMPETGMNSLAGDKGRQQSVDQQKGRADGQGQRSRPDGAGSSSTFSNSFSSSSSSAGSPGSHPRYSSSSSSSSSVSFRINSSGNSWNSRRLSVTSPSASGGSVRDPWREKEDEAKRRQLRRDKQMLLASHTTGNKEQDSNNIYDPFNPTLSDSSGSDEEAESTSLGGSSRHTTHEGKGLARVKTETRVIEISDDEPSSSSAQETISHEVKCVKVEKESRLINTQTKKQTELTNTKVKKESGLDDAGEAEGFQDSMTRLNSADTTLPVHHSLDLVKTERKTLEEECEHSAGPSSAPPNCKNNSSSSSSASTKKIVKAESKSDSKSCSKSPSGDLGHKKKVFQALKERRSSSPETDRGRKGDHHTSGQGGRQREKKVGGERSSRRSRSKERRRRARSTSESSKSNSPDRNRRKRRRSRSRSKDRRRSRSGSSSSSRERSQRNKDKQRIKERSDGREKDSDRRRVSKDKRRGRSRSKSQSKSRSRSRSTSRSRARSKDRKRGRSCSKSRSKSRSRSRSRDRRKDRTRPQQSPPPSRDKATARPKDKRRHRSRSSSRERRKEEGSSSRSSQKTSGSCVTPSKDTKRLQDKKKEKDIARSSIKEEKVASVNKQETPSYPTASKIEKECKDVSTDNQATTAGKAKEIKVEKEIKKEKQPSLDMFEDLPITKSIKKEETDVPASTVVKGIDEEGNEEDPIKTEPCKNIKMEPCKNIKMEPCKNIKMEPCKNIKMEPFKNIKTETCEMPIIKTEPSSPEVSLSPSVTSFSTLTTSVTEDSLEDTVSQSHPVSMASPEQPNTVRLTVPVKQEVQILSDSDDDFNVDMMLDNLDYVKSEQTEGISQTSVKQEKDVDEGKNESTVAGAKSKTPVKRVTWNIQEPEGPQPEKSASKLALYKLKLKQEGARRPSSSAQTSSQDTTGAVCDPSKKGAGGPLSRSSTSDGSLTDGLSTTGQAEGDEGDLSRKDKYLKKLHMQERAIEEVKLAIKPFYQNRDINKDEYKEILRKAVQKVCHSKSGEINPVKVGNLVKAYVDKYKHARKHKKGEDSGKAQEASDSP
ncbi:uncharacterized protein phrf1 [Pagrus major]|uniref:uncharacterized protein phrf1 n=1 Tax=Pagrus major TaxID=143350 RepID=UPI003CC8776F